MPIPILDNTNRLGYIHTMKTQLRNRYKVTMHGNAPVVEDSATFKSVEWFPDVLHDATSRRRADQKAKQMNEQAERE